MQILIGAVSSINPASAGNRVNWVNWVKGLQLLGHHVIFIEQFNIERGDGCSLKDSTYANSFFNVMGRYGLANSCCLLSSDSTQSIGIELSELTKVARNSDLLLNFSGCINSDLVLDNTKICAYLDTDPVFTQLWDSAYNIDIGLRKHNKWLSVGLNIGTPYSPIPDCGLEWLPVGRPMVLDLFNPTTEGGQTLTTVAAWKVFGDLCHQGIWYRSKAYEFQKFIDLPRQTAQPIEIVLREDWGETSIYNILKERGWIIRDGSASVGANLDSYLDFIRNSRADLGIAKHAYVKACSGWFSDRAAHYLASGRPVLHQATGFERNYPVGEGILIFSDLESLVHSIESLNDDYSRHCKASIEFAAEYLDYKKVIPPVLAHCLS